MHNRPAYLMGKRDPLALWSPRVLFFQTAVSLSAAIWSGEYTCGAYVCRRGPVSLNARQRQTRFWLRTAIYWRYAMSNDRDIRDAGRRLERYFEEIRTTAAKTITKSITVPVAKSPRPS